MEVTIRVDIDHFKTAQGDMVKLELSHKKTVRDVLTLLQDQYTDLNFGDLDLDRRSFLVLVNGVEISAQANLETEITPSSEIVIIPVIHGGANQSSPFIFKYNSPFENFGHINQI